MMNKNKIKHMAIRSIRRVFAFISPIRKQAMFESFGGKQYSDNPRAISEQLHSIDPDMKIVWAMNRNVCDTYHLIPDYVRIVIRGSWSYFRAFASSFAYVTNEALDTGIYKKKGQFFVQTWHGDRVPKKVLYQAWRGRERPEPLLDSEYTDICIAGSEIGERVYREAFRYNGEVVNVGMPRNDILVAPDEERIRTTRKKLGIPENTHILLYAPTFRKTNYEVQNTQVDLRRIVDHLQGKGAEWICLIRAHSGSGGVNFDYDSRFVNCSDYFDMADLLLVSDILITDYSSSSGDFILRNKPVILAIYDYEEYTSKYRELNFSLQDAGFFLAHNDEELVEILDRNTDSDFAENCQNICRFFAVNESGCSGQEVARRIVSEYKKSKQKNAS